jgi:hypothetical protein
VLRVILNWYTSSRHAAVTLFLPAAPDRTAEPAAAQNDAYVGTKQMQCICSMTMGGCSA